MTMTDLTVRPFEVHMPDEDLADLRRRIAATRWPSKELVTDRSQGVQLATVQALVTYWGNSYDWRACEAKLNALPQFTTEIDGLDIHFIHMKSAHENALPLIITHGWPGSVIEMLEVIGPLTDPAAHGGRAEDAGIPWDDCDHEDRGDGVFVLVPADVPKALLAESLPPALVTALRTHNDGHPGPERIRLRMALHAGEVHYDQHGVTAVAVNLAFRLLDADPLKAALTSSSGVLAIIVSSWFFEEVVRHGGAAPGYRPGLRQS
jgi:hypothetical protein